MLFPYLIDELDVAVPSRFCYQQLNESQTLIYQKPTDLRPSRICSVVWKAIHANRTYEDMRAGGKTEYPHAVIIDEPATVLQWTGVPNIIGKAKSVIEVISIRKEASGDGSIVNFRDSFRAMRAALLVVNNTPILDANGELMAYATQSHFITEVKDTHRVGDFTVIHHGMRFELTYQFR